MGGGINIVRCTTYTVLSLNYMYSKIHNIKNFVTELYTVGYKTHTILLLKYML